MKKRAIHTLLMLLLVKVASAQSWGTTGNNGLTTSNFLGTTDAKDVIFKTNNAERGRLASTGFWRFGSATNFAKIDSAGKLSFGGTGAYLVAGNKYAFQYAGNTNYGLFFNSTSIQYEFRNGSATPVFYVNANTGNSVFNGTLKIGAYTLPSTDGTNGQVLKTNGSGVVSWGSGNSTVYTAGNGINITNNVISVPYLKTDGNFNTGVGQLALISNTTGGNNTANGYEALGNNTTGSANVANGTNALGANTTGYYNTANGYQALGYNTTGAYNTANGIWALGANTTGYDNAANGAQALGYNTTGYDNTADGAQALYSNTTGYSNVAIGVNALYNNTVGHNLIAIGDSALYNQVESPIYGNTAIGNKALYANTTGFNNTALGSGALLNNSTGLANVAVGESVLTSNTIGGDNTASGVFALSANTSGNDNSANGGFALMGNTTGSDNSADGIAALLQNSTGSYNTASGGEALNTNTTGSNNSALGYNATVSAGNLTNATVIGANATVDASNKVRIGNTSVTSIGGQVGWTTFSDGRYKKNIKEDVKGLAFINALRPVTYTLDLKAVNEYYNKGRKLSDSAYKQMKAAMADGEAAGSKIIHTGFIAQEVEAAANKLNYDFDGVDKPQTKDGLYGLRYSEFVVPLVKAVQELSKGNNDKDEKIDSLQNRLSNVESELQQLKSLVLQIQQCSPCAANASSSAAINKQSIVLADAAVLEQNAPNPFNNATTIGYTLPQKFVSAKIIITDKNGSPLKQVNLSAPGKGTINIDASVLAAGTYNYTLYVDGKMAGSKQMVLTK